MTRLRFGFHLRLGIGLAMLAAGASGRLAAQEQALPETEPPGFEATPLPELSETDAAPEAESEGGESRIADTLDTLFIKLRRATSDREATDINRSIQLRWIQSGSDTVDLLMQRVLQAMKTKDYPLALDLLDAVIDLRPDYAEGWNKRATVYYVMQDFGRSLSDIEQTLRLEPRHFGALTGLGSILKQLGKREEALHAFERTLEIYPRMDSAQKAYRDLLEAAEDEDI